MGLISSMFSRIDTSRVNLSRSQLDTFHAARTEKLSSIDGQVAELGTFGTFEFFQ